MSYHGQIINLPATPPPDVAESPVKDICIAYKTGHRDARHAARHDARRSPGIALCVGRSETAHDTAVNTDPALKPTVHDAAIQGGERHEKLTCNQ